MNCYKTEPLATRLQQSGRLIADSPLPMNALPLELPPMAADFIQGRFDTHLRLHFILPLSQN